MQSYESWLKAVNDVLASAGMPLKDWQARWRFDFQKQFDSGTTPHDAAAKANRFWWFNQNKALGEECKKTKDCWLPGLHEGACEQL